jgi:hypothetical protein
MKVTIEDIINQVQLNTKCVMNNTTYEIIDIKPYSDVCNTPSYTLKIIDTETIEEKKISLNSFKNIIQI